MVLARMGVEGGGRANARSRSRERESEREEEREGGERFGMRAHLGVVRGCITVAAAQRPLYRYISTITWHGERRINDVLKWSCT